jgi:hypothetical protein
MDSYELVHRARRLQRDAARLGDIDPMMRLSHRHHILRVQIADVVRLMRYAASLGEVPTVTQRWAQFLEDALDHDEP